MTDLDPTWSDVTDAVGFAVSRVVDDADPLNEREAADGHQYVLRIVAAVAQSSLLSFDPRRPSFMGMLDQVRHLGASGPDIDYDVAMIEPGVRHRVSGVRGGASYVGLCVYSHAGDKGAAAIVEQVDIDAIAAEDGTFAYEFRHADAARVIMRQYFHDRGVQGRGSWTIERLEDTSPATATASTALTPPLPTLPSVRGRLASAAASIRWNARLNELWSPERRATPNLFVRQTADEIVAAVPNPDVTYAFSWWSVPDGHALVIDLTPPDTVYWALQICDRWFQCYPDRRSNLNDRQVTAHPDGTVQLVLADGDPGRPNWLDTSGHRIGTMFFRWLHADPDVLPVCSLVPLTSL